MSTGQPSQGRGRGQGWRGRGRGQGWRGGDKGHSWRGGRGGNYHKQWRGGAGSGGSGSSYGGYARSTGHMNIPATPTNSQSLNRNVASTSRHMTTSYLHVASPYVGWHLYFPDVVYSEHSPLLQHIQLFEKYFVSWEKLFNWEDIEEKGHFTVDFKDLNEDKNVKESYPELSQELKTSPESVLSCLGLAVHQIVSLRHQEDHTDDEGQRTSSHISPYIIARIKNFGTPLALKNFKANYYGKFVSIKGTVVRVGNIKPLCIKMAFQCITCSHIQAVSLPDGKYTQPTNCPADGCRGRSFTPFRSHYLTQTVDWQTVRVQELMSDDQKDSGRIPRTIDCELTRDLVDSCVPGDIITVTGSVKVNKVDDGRSKSKDKCMFLLYLHGNHVFNSKGCKRKADQIGTGSGLAMDFSMKDLYAVQEIHGQESLFALLVASLCPSIFGHEMVKAGIILGLFGSTAKFANDKNRIPVRGDPHILIVGDPGLGKSQMLQAATSVAPRSVYVCGNTTTTSGLTVTLSKDSGSGDFALEAGALVLADQGCCCIDEFDKMGSQHQALLEAMEQQSISIAKAGIVCSLPARTSILAAANPVGGHYNKGKTVAENLKMGSALLSRFDLVFILLDKPDQEMDCMLSEHVMALHGGRQEVSSSFAVRRESILNESVLGPDGMSLNDRLKASRTEVTDPIPHQLMRKYVAYARKYVHSKIGKEAASVLQDFYLLLRRQHQSVDSTPITTRQLESLIRLTEARARLELREVATKSDAQDVVELMKYSMQDVYSDQFGLLDFQRSQHGSGMSGRSAPKKFVSALQRVSEQTYNNIFTVQQMRQIAKEINMQIPDFESFLTSLNNQGFLLKKGSKVYQLQTFG